MSPVEQLYDDYRATHEILVCSEEVSAANFLADEFRKVLLIASASYQETEVCRVIDEAVAHCSRDKAWLCKFVRSRVTARNYHSLFDWNATNANGFFGMLGEELLAASKELMKTDEQFAPSVSAFLEIGRDRNRLVHGNYASFTLEKTPEELLGSFRTAMYFIDSLECLLNPVETSAI